MFAYTVNFTYITTGWTNHPFEAMEKKASWSKSKTSKKCFPYILNLIIS